MTIQTPRIGDTVIVKYWRTEVLATISAIRSDGSVAVSDKHRGRYAFDADQLTWLPSLGVWTARHP